jgi:hypothetical protein
VVKANVDVKLVNDLYLECFQRILPSARNHSEKIKCEAVLLKNFGKYMVTCGMKQKGMEALEKSVTAHQELLLEEHQRLSQSLNEK